MKESKDVVISFDTTGSMYPCLTQVRRNVESLVNRLFKDIPNLRVGILAHGDYCDEKSTYITKMLDLTDDKNKICHFIRNVEATNGGDAPECYEFVLNQIRNVSWKSDKNKVFVMIGDDVAHPSNDPQNKRKLDWKNEVGLLKESGIKIYSVQALNRGHATSFWQSIANKSDGYYLPLDQFSDIASLITAVGYKQKSDKDLEDYEKELIVNGHMNRSIDSVIGTLLKRKSSSRYKSPRSLHSVPDGRFQVMYVDETTPIKEFVQSQGITFEKGRGFYEFTKRRKPTKIQDYKEVILMEDATGDFYSGNKAREMAGIPVGRTAELQPTLVKGYTVFIQSTSVNRALQAGTRFLYEVPDYEK